MIRPIPHRTTRAGNPPPLNSRINSNYTGTPFSSRNVEKANDGAEEVDRDDADGCAGVEWAECTTHPVEDTIAGFLGGHVD